MANVLGYSLIITNQAGQSIDLYDDPEVALMTSEGLDYESNILTTTYYEVDGGAYDGTTVPPRTISLTIQYQYTHDDEAAKLRVHDVFTPKDELVITYITPNQPDGKQIKGYCEKCITPPNEYPMVTTVSIICPDPWWMIPNSPEVSVAIPGIINYPGTIQNGFKIFIEFISDATEVIITTNGDQFVLRTMTVSPFNWYDPLNGGITSNDKFLRSYYRSGSRIEIDTRIGYKSVMYYGNPQNCERFVDTLPSNIFPMLKPGANDINISSDGDINAYILYSAKYRR